MHIKEYKKLLEEGKSILKNPKNKYHAKKVRIDNILFDSIKEASRYKELKLLLRAGEIKNLILQPEFELMPSFIYKGEVIESITYVSDFKYIDLRTGETIIEDAKGFRTDVYIIKKKLFLEKYGHKYKFIES